MANTETVEKILHAATVLFAERGFAETSLRTITSMADVNLAAVNYHFGSKKSLIQAVFTRFLEPLCHQLNTELDKLAIELNEQAPTVNQIILCAAQAFVATQNTVDERPERFAALMMMAYTQSQEHLRTYCNERYGKTLTRFMGLLQEAAPHTNFMQFYWRINFMLGASLFTLSSFESIVAMLGKSTEEIPLDEMLGHLVPAMSGLLQSE